ncbi:MAG TPA: GTPase [Candidatus Limnocylindrales bacterium]|nr:GTPase [Candidatus Limnocylindrales bacterium]
MSDAPPVIGQQAVPADRPDDRPDDRGRLRPEDALARLVTAIEAARTLGIPVDAAEAVRVDAEARLGFPADVYVLALVGGTGVGKSSLLNALAGEAVSQVSVRRPTTDEPVAWVPRQARRDLDELFAWLDVHVIREHDSSGPGNVAVIDLPDIDSVEALHRERVERLLPRVDAVIWVTDPEKYHDAVLYDDFLRQWMPRLDRQAIVLNKSDRLGHDAVTSLRRDLERDLATRLAVPGRSQPSVIVTSAIDGAAALEELRGWVAAQVEAKRIVRDRLLATIVATLDGLARQAGIDPLTPAEPFLGPGPRRAAIEAASSAVTRALDLPALERQAVAATRARARARGTGPIGLVTSTIYRLSGREARVADPDRYLVEWREHGSLAPAVDALRQALTEPIRTAAPAVRPTLAASAEPAGVRRSLERAVDTAIGRQDRAVPSSRVWPLIGLLQTVATWAIVLSVAWNVVWILARPPVGSIEVPVLGPIPIPFAALVVSLVAGYAFARILGLHAGWVGRRWAADLRRDIAAAVERELTDRALEPLDRLEAARRQLWTAARATSRD